MGIPRICSFIPVLSVRFLRDCLDHYSLLSTGVSAPRVSLILLIPHTMTRRLVILKAPLWLCYSIFFSKKINSSILLAKLSPKLLDCCSRPLIGCSANCSITVLPRNLCTQPSRSAHFNLNELNLWQHRIFLSFCFSKSFLFNPTKIMPPRWSLLRRKSRSWWLLYPLNSHNVFCCAIHLEIYYILLHGIYITPNWILIFSNVFYCCLNS